MPGLAVAFVASVVGAAAGPEEDETPLAASEPVVLSENALKPESNGG